MLMSVDQPPAPLENVNMGGNLAKMSASVAGGDDGGIVGDRVVVCDRWVVGVRVADGDRVVNGGSGGA